MIAYAQEHIEAAESFLDMLQSAILFPLMTLMVGVALLVFLWGGFEFVRAADSDQGREKGKQHMIWGIVGLLIMIAAWGIMEIALNTFDIALPGDGGSPQGPKDPCTQVPRPAECDVIGI